jgi:proteasome lid subunit RPN8/RPN11
MLRLQNEHFAAIVAHAREAAPSECCGLMGGSDDGLTKSIYRLRNVADHPHIAYEAAPEELFAAQREMRERAERLLVIYHSHPRALDPAPSDTDTRLAYYPEATYLIVALGGESPIVRAFKISESQQSWEMVEYEIACE